MNKKMGLVLLSLLPSLVFASSSSSLNFGEAFLIENFMTIFMSIFVIYPIAKYCSKDGNVKSLFIKLSVIRYVLLIFFDIFISTDIAMWDFMFVFIGAFLVVPIVAVANSKKPAVVTTSSNITQSSNVKLACANCKTEITVDDKFCPNCGMAIKGNNIEVSASKKNIVTPSSFDSIYSKPEEQMLESFLQSEMKKAKINSKTDLIPKDVLKRKNIMFIILSLLTFIFISMIFFHVGVIYCLIAIFIIFIFYKKSNSYNLMKFLKKEVKSRPQEDISNIVMNVKLSFIKDSSKKVLLGGFIAVLLISSTASSSVFTTTASSLISSEAVQPTEGTELSLISETIIPRLTADASVCSEFVSIKAILASIDSIKALILNSWDCFKSRLPNFKQTFFLFTSGCSIIELSSNTSCVVFLASLKSIINPFSTKPFSMYNSQIIYN